MRGQVLLFLLPLALGAQPDATIHQEYRYQLPRPALTWTPVEGLPSGLRIIPETAEIWGAPNEAGQFQFALRGSDGSEIALELKVNALWNLSLTPPQAAVGVAFSHAQVVGGGTPPYTFSATGLPPGLTISRDGLISGTPTQSGNYSATITAADHQGNTLSLAYGLHVNAMSITTTSLPPVEPDKPYSQQLSATGGKLPYTWSLINDSACLGLGQHPIVQPPLPAAQAGQSTSGVYLPPPNLTPDGLLTLETPILAGQTLCVQVTDSGGNQAISTLTITSLAPGGSPLSASLFPRSQEVSVGDPVWALVSTYSGTPPYTASALSLPSGFVFYPDQGYVFGYPQTPGVQSILIQVKDGVGATANCTTILSVSPIRVGSGSVGNPTFGKPFSRQFYAVNAAPPNSWTIIPGPTFNMQLPAGMTFSAAGLLSGTPLEAGHFFPAARVTDAAGNSRRFGLGGETSSGPPRRWTFSALARRP